MDPHNGDLGPDPSVHFNLNLDCDSILMGIRIWILLVIKATTGLKTPQGSISSLSASIVSVHGPLWLHFEPLKLQNFDFNADPEPASQNNVVPDTQPWFETFILIFLAHLSFVTSDVQEESCRFAVQTIKNEFSS